MFDSRVVSTLCNRTAGEGLFSLPKIQVPEVSFLISLSWRLWLKNMDGDSSGPKLWVLTNRYLLNDARIKFQKLRVHSNYLDSRVVSTFCKITAAERMFQLKIWCSESQLLKSLSWRLWLKNMDCDPSCEHWCVLTNLYLLDDARIKFQKLRVHRNYFRLQSCKYFL